MMSKVENDNLFIQGAGLRLLGIYLINRTSENLSNVITD